MEKKNWKDVLLTIFVVVLSLLCSFFFFFAGGPASPQGSSQPCFGSGVGSVPGSAVADHGIFRPSPPVAFAFFLHGHEREEREEREEWQQPNVVDFGTGGSSAAGLGWWQ